MLLRICYHSDNIKHFLLLCQGRLAQAGGEFDELALRPRVPRLRRHLQRVRS